MSTNYYYRVDALRDDQKAGDAVFVRAPNLDKARDAVLGFRDDLRDGWTLTPVKIKKEDYPVADTPELVIPPIDEVMKLAFAGEPTPDERDQYNSWATEFIREALVAQETAPNVPPRLRTRYPSDVVNAETDTRDTVSLGRHGEVVVVDTGDA